MSTLSAATAVPATPLAARRRRRRRAAAVALHRGLLPPAHRGGGDPLKAARGRADVVGEPRTTGSTERREDA